MSFCVLLLLLLARFKIAVFLFFFCVCVWVLSFLFNVASLFAVYDSSFFEGNKKGCPTKTLFFFFDEMTQSSKTIVRPYHCAAAHVRKLQKTSCVTGLLYSLLKV